MPDEFVDSDPFDPHTDDQDAANLKAALNNKENQSRILIENRIGAYMRMFKEGTPSRADRELVLADIEMFCRYNQSVFTDSERLTNLLLGRQEVALRIHEHLRMSVDEMLTTRT